MAQPLFQKTSIMPWNRGHATSEICLHVKRTCVSNSTSVGILACRPSTQLQGRSARRASRCDAIAKANERSTAKAKDRGPEPRWSREPRQGREPPGKRGRSTRQSGAPAPSAAAARAEPGAGRKKVMLGNWSRRRGRSGRGARSRRAPAARGRELRAWEQAAAAQALLRRSIRRRTW